MLSHGRGTPSLPCQGTTLSPERGDSGPLPSCAGFHLVEDAGLTNKCWDEIFHESMCVCFLAVQNSSIGDLVTDSLTDSLSEPPFDF